ncbi:MAG: hypothetical protein WCT44_02245 [Candidatus Paceibacterota bacterium]
MLKKIFRTEERFNRFIIFILALLAVFALMWLASRVFKNVPFISTPEENSDKWLDDTFNWQNLDKTIYAVPENIYPRGFNLLFVADDFLSFDEFKVSVKKIVAEMKKVEPWKSHSEINIFMIYQNDPILCEVKEEKMYAPMLKCGKDLIKLVQTLPLIKVKVIVVSREQFVSWSNTSRLENTFVFYSLPANKEEDAFNYKIFLHELAMGFGLREEMRSIMAESGSAPARPEGPNCAPTVDIAKDWWGDFVRRADSTLVFSRAKNDVGFYFGCAGNQDYIRPTQKSLMNIQDFPDAETYGPVSEDYLKKVLQYCFSGKIYDKKTDSIFFEQYKEFKACLGEEQTSLSDSI